MKRCIILMILGLMTTVIQANNLPPVAVLNSTPDRTWFYNAEDVVFDYYDSYDEEYYIVGTRWYINNVRIYSSDNDYTMSECFVLYGNPTNGCYELADGVTTVSIKLGVKDAVGQWDYDTKTYTIKEHKGRKYFIKDHLGSVRTTVNRDGNVLGHDDYYPFGLAMPGRSSNSANPNDNYKYIGEELDDDAGINLMNLNARNYDPVTGRFLQIDPLFDHPNQIGLSPYNYSWNDPVNLSDPTGECPACWGAVIGFAVELGAQAAKNIANGEDAFSNIDWLDVGTSTLAGAASGGISTFKNAGIVGKGIATVALSVGEDATKANMGTQTSDYGGDEILISVITGSASFGLGEFAETTARASKEGSRLEGIARRAEDRATRAPTNNYTSDANRTRARADNFTSTRAQTGSASVRAGSTGVQIGTGTTNSNNRSFLLSPSSMNGGARADNTRVAIPLRLQN